ncbi:helix-turn-helix transcriptional regulator [Dietzia lutea]|uniref:Helix-turn-helix transcriptional regulator n=1 Tax=Dietzia lutea TaxID=546160 RepID=A0A2S1R9D1_9ACTN|nr:response regulator transcription factor [Dietzia lutea]AWH92890.1 helix-turn-helix transcriptional regulator [Dietzia lutea]
MPVRVSVVDDYSVVIAGVTAFLAPYSDRIEIVSRQRGTSGATEVDVALYDSFASPLGSSTRLEALLQDPTIGSVAIYSFASDPVAIRDSLDAGARGFLSKSLDAADLVSGIEQIAAGHQVTATGSDADSADQSMRPDRWPAKQAGLSPREAEMIALIVQGLSNDQIAEWCYLSPNTVKTYIRSAYRKMGVTTRAQAVTWGIRSGLKPDLRS